MLTDKKSYMVVLYIVAVSVLVISSCRGGDYVCSLRRISITTSVPFFHRTLAFQLSQCTRLKDVFINTVRISESFLAGIATNNCLSNDDFWCGALYNWYAIRFVSTLGLVKFIWGVEFPLCPGYLLGQADYHPQPNGCLWNQRISPFDSSIACVVSPGTLLPVNNDGRNRKDTGKENDPVVDLALQNFENYRSHPGITAVVHKMFKYQV